jgi:hypothetical protein
MIMRFKLFWILFSESREICRYVAEKYEGQGYPFLLGKDALERASVEEWLHIEEHAFNPPSRALFCYLAFPADRYDNGDDTDMHIRKLEEVLDIYEQRLRAIVNSSLGTSSPLLILFTFQTHTILKHPKSTLNCMTQGKMLGGGGMLFLSGLLGSTC